MDGYSEVAPEILSGVFSSLRCTDCGSLSLTLTENQFKRSGFASCLRLFCENCGWRTEFHSSKKQTRSFEVNRRLVYTMRWLGKGHAGAKKFYTLMNMPPPSAAKPFKKSGNTITKAIKTIEKKECQMLLLKLEVHRKLKIMTLSIVLCHVMALGRSVDFPGKNGCVAVISIDTGKVLDVEAMSKSCKQCQLHSHLDKDSVEYQLWRADHNHCTANFQGSAPAMEPEGTERIFRRSIETHKLRYSKLYGDGDSKSHKQVKDVYSDDA